MRTNIPVLRYWVMAAALLLAELPAASFAQSQTATALVSPGVFDTIAVYSSDVRPFYKWTGVLNRFHDEIKSATKPCPEGAWTACEPDEWRQLIGALKNLDLRGKVELVNAAINRHPYVRSIDNWAQVNYWETPFEFLHVNGQCQDYAITKYLLLRAAGVPDDLLRVVVLRDMNLQLDHAVLVVDMEGEQLLLDNQINVVVPASAVKHYRPYYAINESGWWRLMPQRPANNTVVASSSTDSN